jgi:hypothetical protein
VPELDLKRFVNASSLTAAVPAGEMVAFIATTGVLRMMVQTVYINTVVNRWWFVRWWDYLVGL